MPDDTVYRCISPSCGRAMPRPVNFCPWCGAAQTAAARALADARADRTRDAGDADADAEADAEARRAALAAAGATVAASLSGWSDVPEAPDAPAPTPAPTPAPPVQPKPAAASQPAPAPAPAAAAAARAKAFGRAATAAGGAPPRQGAGPSTPRQREPIRLRWWILALVVLWGVWLVAKPSARKTERRIEAAIGLARECRAKEAQDALIALRRDRATPAQLERLQKALNEEAGKCTRRRQRDKAWNEASSAAEAALDAGNAERARLRLQAFVKRWGEDEDTRALRARIDAARHPLAVPRSGASGGSGSSGTAAGGDAESARNLVREARADLARGAFHAAGDKMTLCLTMVDPGNRDCAALKAQAEREGRFQ